MIARKKKKGRWKDGDRWTQSRKDPTERSYLRTPQYSVPAVQYIHVARRRQKARKPTEITSRIWKRVPMCVPLSLLDTAYAFVFSRHAAAIPIGDIRYGFVVIRDLVTKARELTET